MTIWGYHPLLSHLSLLDDVVGVTAWEACTLQKVHDIILTATMTDASKQMITWYHWGVIFSDYSRMDSASTTILTSPSSCLRSTDPSWHQWLGEGRLPLCRSGGRYLSMIKKSCKIIFSQSAIRVWISRLVQTQHLDHQGYGDSLTTIKVPFPNIILLKISDKFATR